jgi:hypothetical protein
VAELKTSTMKSIQAKALKEFEGIANKCKDALPTTGRIERQIAEKRKKVQTRVTSITLFFRRANAGDAGDCLNVPGYGGHKAKRTMGTEGKEASSYVAKKTPNT